MTNKRNNEINKDKKFKNVQKQVAKIHLATHYNND